MTMTNNAMVTLLDQFQAEATMRTEEYRRVLDSIIRMAEEAKGRPASDHVSHNLLSRVHEVAVAATRVNAAVQAKLTIEMAAQS
jgi:polyhydroxyalkanoate synthesis regulator phasin